MKSVNSMTILSDMASRVIRSTYSLDAETVDLLDQLAAKQGTSKSEALRRAIRLAAGQEADSPEDPVALLEAFQREMALTQEDADRWIAEVRAERQAWQPPER